MPFSTQHPHLPLEPQLLQQLQTSLRLSSCQFRQTRSTAPMKWEFQTEFCTAKWKHKQISCKWHRFTTVFPHSTTLGELVIGEQRGLSWAAPNDFCSHCTKVSSNPDLSCAVGSPHTAFHLNTVCYDPRPMMQTAGSVFKLPTIINVKNCLAQQWRVRRTVKEVQLSPFFLLNYEVPCLDNDHTRWTHPLLNINQRGV